MKKQIVSAHAPSAIGPYSQAIALGNMIFVSGQLPLDPTTGHLETGIIDQTRRSLKNIKAILEQENCGMEDIVKTTVFLSDLNDFSAMNEVYSEFFSAPYPARAAVQVAKLPKDALVEIEAIAARVFNG